METNPYLEPSNSEPSPEQNPYLKAAMADATTAQVVRNLAQLLAETPLPNSGETLVAQTSVPKQPIPGTQGTGSYASALEFPGPQVAAAPTADISAGSEVVSDYRSIAKTTEANKAETAETISSHKEYISLTDSSDYKTTQLQPSSDLASYSAPVSPPMTSSSGDRPLSSPAPPSQSPYHSPQEAWQAQVEARQAALRQQQLAQAQARQAAAKRRQLELRAQQFLARLDKRNTLEGDRMWFEAFAELCPSRLEAAIEFIQTMEPSP